MAPVPDKNESAVLLRAIDRSQAWIEFTPDGEIINANDLFLDCMGYTLDEIRGKHHRIFVDSDYAHSSEYSHFWEGLKRGEYKTAEYMRVGKGGREVWLQATYTPVPNDEGETEKVVKLATDVTEQRRARANDTAKIEAIEKSMAVIEFNIDGTILRANDVFLDLMGYESHEIEGKHHRIFVSPEFGGSSGVHGVLARSRAREVSLRPFRTFDQDARVSLAPSHLLADPGSQRKACKGSQIRVRHHRADPTGCRT